MHSIPLMKLLDCTVYYCINIHCFSIMTYILYAKETLNACGFKKKGKKEEKKSSSCALESIVMYF